ncbi:MAG TPA: hypothetical protein VGG64_25630 [Pirellulales bacterium]|jgi:hypothetical protein
MSTITPPADEPATQPTQRSPWGFWARLLVSVVLAWHLTAILVGPFSLPPTLIANRLQPRLRPYLGALYLGHGYKFFAPNPGPSHLIRYELEFTDGTHRGSTFPSLADQWPRLFYHRHFMLSEFINSVPPDPSVPPFTEWTKLPLSTEQQIIARSYADHLLHKHHARRVTLWMREHLIPTPDQVAKGMRLDDVSLYSERKLGSYMGMP